LSLLLFYSVHNGRFFDQSLQVNIIPIFCTQQIIVIVILYSYIDEHKPKFIKNLSDAVAIKSVSSWPETRPEIFKMMKWAASRLEALGATTELKDIGKQVLFY
jgi:hypothetical protein